MAGEHPEITFSPCRKLRLVNPTLWSHHYGGWTHTVGLIEQHLCCDDGLLFITSVEDIATDGAKVISEPWVGMVHQVPQSNYEWFPDLKRMVVETTFRQSLMQCKGLFCMSTVISKFLREHLPDIPVTRLLYPYTPTDARFNKVDFFCSRKNPTRVLFIGEYMRNFQYFFDFELPVGFQKILLHSPDVDMEKQGIVTNESVAVRQYVDNDDYDTLLCNSVVFLNLLDACANTTVLECIIRNTPVVVNRLPGLEEYLGKDYPLFYDTVSEAREMLTSNEALQKGCEHLENLALKPFLTGNSFLHALQNSATYRLLPVPASQKTVSQRIPEYELTVMICSYKRVYNMENLLHCFHNQTIDKKVEIIIWNNNYFARDELQLICDGFKRKLDIKVVHSTENYYCIVRLAVTSLMRSDVLIVCDDDVVPSPVFLEEYMAKYVKYGPDTILCCRGHKFWRHELDEEHPEITWMMYEDLKFYDESEDDVKIHFLHADTCLFPKHILAKAIQYPLPNYDFILVDDYWLSYVFSHLLRIPIWKIKGNHLFTSTPCAEDDKIALYKNSRVREERINFYAYHMRQGWPNSVQCIGEDDD